MFYFLDQLEYKDGRDGFVGQSPLMNYSRAFAIEGNAVKVSDVLTFKSRINFHELFLCPWAELESSDSDFRCQISTSLLANHSYPIQSSTGSARWHAHKITDALFKKGDQLTWTYLYQVT
jgi:hypothetical protein